MAQAAAQSNLPNVAAQIGQFLNVSREAARRVGLTQVLAAAGEPFDPQRHQLVEGTAAPAEAAPIAGTLAPGYTYQGQLLRLPLVGFASPEDTK